MPSIYRHALMPYSTRQMFNVVNEVDKYPSFLPWCSSSKIVSQTDTSMDASINMKMGKLNHSFTTRNTLKKDSLIHMQLLNGPFKRLSGDWIFSSLPDDGCKIELKLDFEYSNKVIAMLIGPVFNKIANSLVDAFCQRAHQIYRNPR